MAKRPEAIGSFDDLEAAQSQVRSETEKREAGLLDLLRSLHSLYWECFGLLSGQPSEGDVERALSVVSTAAFMSLQGSLRLIEVGYYAQAAVVVRLILAEYLSCLAFRGAPECATLFLSQPSRRVPAIGKLLERLADVGLSQDKIATARSDLELLHRHAHGAPQAVIAEVVGRDGQGGLWHYPRYDEERCRWVGSRAAVWAAAVLALMTDHFEVLRNDQQWSARFLSYSNQLNDWLEALPST